MNLIEIYIDFLNQIPKNEFSVITYLDIIDGQEKENIISKIYAYYLDPNKNPIISGWFINGLTELIALKNKEAKINFTNYQVFTEYASLNNEGRIDIVLLSESDKSAIIIENKVNHILLNDLNNYWNTFPDSNYLIKKGILLTLNNTNSNHPNFVTITHGEWIKNVENKIHWEKLTKREKIQLEDFLINIKYISKNYVMNENILFYSNYHEKVDSLISLKEQAYSYINNIIKSIADSFDWKVYGSSNEFKQIWNERNEERVFYTIFPNQILKEKKLILKIQVDGYAIDFYDEIHEFTLNKIKDDQNLLNLNLEKQSNNYFLLTTQTLMLSDNDFENLESIILNIIEQIEPLRKQIFEYLIKIKG